MLTSHPAVAQSPVPITEVAVLWEVNVGQNGATDYMTSVNSAERDQYSFLGAMAYIQAEGLTALLFRLFDGSFDHMDWSAAGEGGYETQDVLGSPWTSSSAVPGLSPVTRMWNTSTGDHATTTPFDVPYYAGYQADSNYGGRYGYQRYGNKAYALTTGSGGGVTEGSDTIAGGAVASGCGTVHSLSTALTTAATCRRTSRS